MFQVSGDSSELCAPFDGLVHVSKWTSMEEMSNYTHWPIEPTTTGHIRAAAISVDQLCEGWRLTN